MISPYFIFLGLALSLYGGLHYFLDTIHGRVKPNKMSWGLWALAPLIAFAAELKQGVGLQSLMTFIVGFNPLMIFLASFVNKKSYWKISRFDIWCALLSIAGIVLWFVTQKSDVAIIFSIAADLLAGIPTLKKSFFAPETESYEVFFYGLVNAIITLLTIKIWNLAYVGFPLYIVAFNTTAVLLIKCKLGKIVQKL
jgi:hypothetical protein